MWSHLVPGGTGSPLYYPPSQPAPSPPCHAATSVLLLRHNNIRTAMRKINSLCYDGCALISDVQLISNVLQQTWPLSGLDFTDTFWGGTSPHLFCSVWSLCNFWLIKLSSLLTLPSRSTLRRKIFRHARPRDGVLPAVHHSNRKGPWKKHSRRSCSQAVPIGNSPARPGRASAGSGTGLENNMTNFSSLNENCTTSFMLSAWYRSLLYVLHDS